MENDSRNAYELGQELVRYTVWSLYSDESHTLDKKIAFMHISELLNHFGLIDAEDKLSLLEEIASNLAPNESGASDLGKVIDWSVLVSNSIGVRRSRSVGDYCTLAVLLGFLHYVIKLNNRHTIEFLTLHSRRYVARLKASLPEVSAGRILDLCRRAETYSSSGQMDPTLPDDSERLFESLFMQSEAPPGLPSIVSQEEPSTEQTLLRQPVRLFYSYSHKDEKLREKLEEHLALLQRQGVIAGWHDRKIGAGEEWKGAIDKNLEEAQVILLLVSSSFLASDYCYDSETKRAVERHDRGEARVIPVILRPCDWHGAPFAKFQSLPRDDKAVTSWSNKDEAWTDVAKGIRRAIEALTANPR